LTIAISSTSALLQAQPTSKPIDWDIPYSAGEGSGLVDRIITDAMGK
jgi:hypothetical protein